jgi:hypothetical protein
MTIFWIFAAIFGITTFSYGYLLAGWGIFGSLVAAVFGMIALRGIVSWIRRSMVLRERLPDEDDGDRRTLETNRYIFWRRLFLLTLFPGVELVVVYASLVNGGATPLGALATMASAVGQGLLLVVQLGALFLANFLIFFGPFVLFSKMGRQTLQPGDANYEVKIEDVRGQKSAVQEMLKILKLMEQGRTYVKAGGKRERGVLMVGPPGTGKTRQARSFAPS